MLQDIDNKEQDTLGLEYGMEWGTPASHKLIPNILAPKSSTGMFQKGVRPNQNYELDDLRWT
jgi:hypothetical protein